MITGEIKTKIDNIWDAFWTGGITNSITVLEQMTYLFFMKMLDDAQCKKEATANLLGVPLKDPVFKEGHWLNPETNTEVPYSDLRWNVFKNKDAGVMFNLIRTHVFPFIKQLNGEKESAYSRFMGSAIFLIPTERTLVKIVDGINGLDMTNRDAMGDVYEYVLGKMAASGTNGQFRTPRHIIRMMVELMQPTLKDEICDPAMGSAGFLAESAKYIQEHFEQELMNGDNNKHFHDTMFTGYDTDTDMLRIGCMNMTLHGVENPTIRYNNSLAEEYDEANKYSLILANPPFSGSLDPSTVARSLNQISGGTKKTELLFLSLFLRLLNAGGRCVSIIPVGVLNNTNDKAYTRLRKTLVEEQKLEAIIYLPSGVFQPYSGVQTGILVFTKTNSGGTDKVWLYNMEADGLSLDQKRLPIEENDIPDVVARWNNLEEEANRSRYEKSFFVDKQDFVDNDYIFSFNKYQLRKIEEKIYTPTNELLKSINDLEIEFKQIMDEINTFNS